MVIRVRARNARAQFAVRDRVVSPFQGFVSLSRFPGAAQSLAWLTMPLPLADMCLPLAGQLIGGWVLP